MPGGSGIGWAREGLGHRQRVTAKWHSADLLDSAVFNDMLSLEGLVPTSTDTSSSGGLDPSDALPIPIDGTCAAVEMLLDFALQEEVDSLGAWPLIGSAYHLAAKYELGVARGRMMSRLTQLVKTAPWETFVLAAQYDRLALGRLALTHMGKEDRRDVVLASRMSYDEGVRLRVAWLIPYMALAARMHFESRHGFASSRPTWSESAAGFKPVAPGVAVGASAPRRRKAAELESESDDETESSDSD